MEELIFELKRLMGNAKLLIEANQVKSRQLDEKEKAQGLLEIEQRDKIIELKAREDAVADVENTVKIKGQLTVDMDRVSKERSLLVEDIHKFKQEKANELEKIRVSKEDLDAQQRSLTAQRLKLDEDVKSYKEKLIDEMRKKLG